MMPGDGSLEGVEGILHYPYGLLVAPPTTCVRDVLARGPNSKRPVPQGAVLGRREVFHIPFVDVESPQPVLDFVLCPRRDLARKRRLRCPAPAPAVCVCVCGDLSVYKLLNYSNQLGCLKYVLLRSCVYGLFLHR
jgi:hypothetical protein